MAGNDSITQRLMDYLIGEIDQVPKVRLIHVPVNNTSHSLSYKTVIHFHVQKLSQIIMCG